MDALIEFQFLNVRGSQHSVQIGATLTVIATALLTNTVLATDPTTLSEVVKDIQAVCTQPATQGEHWSVSGDAAGEAGVQIRLLKVADVKGAIHFTREEWSGIQRVLAAEQANDNKDYRACAREVTPKFLEKIK